MKPTLKHVVIKFANRAMKMTGAKTPFLGGQAKG